MTSNTRRQFLKRSGVAAGTMAMLAGCSGDDGGDGSSDGGTGGTTTSQPDPVQMSIGHGIAAEEPLILMKAMPDLLDNAGTAYEVSWSTFPANNARFQAYQAGKLDGGQAPAITSMFAIDRGLPIIVVASITQETEDGFNEPFLARPDSDLDLSAEGLRGTKLGVCAFKSACDLWAQSAALKAGLTVGEDVEIVKVPFPSLGQSIDEGQVDSGPLANFFAASAQQKFGLEARFTTLDVIGQEHELLDLWFDQQFLDQNGEAVRAFLADYNKAMNFYNENTDEAKAALVENTDYIPVPLDAYKQIPEYGHNIRPLTDSLELINQQAVDIGWLDEPINLDLLYDLSYLPE